MVRQELVVAGCREFSERTRWPSKGWEDRRSVVWALWVEEKLRLGGDVSVAGSRALPSGGGGRDGGWQDEEAEDRRTFKAQWRFEA